MKSLINPAPGQTAPKWRGIKTTQEKINEDKAVTIKNRLGQLSFSLPRIDDDKRWAGFPGLAGASPGIAPLVPYCKYYVEPFAGAARTFQEVVKFGRHKKTQFILNDKSNFINEWLKREFLGIAMITQQDFAASMKRWDSKTTFFLIDLPWVKSFYQQGFATFDRKDVAEYEEEVLEICRKLQGKFIITTRPERTRMQKANYYHKIIRSVYVVSGKYPRVLLTANFDLRKKK